MRVVPPEAVKLSLQNDCLGELCCLAVLSISQSVLYAHRLIAGCYVPSLLASTLPGGSVVELG